MPGDFQLHNEPVDVILASALRPGCTLLFKCEVLNTGCSMEYGTIQQMIAHIKQNHPQYNLVLSRPLRAECLNCSIYFSRATTNCATCAQEILTYMWGTINYESQMNSPLDLGFGGMGMNGTSEIWWGGADCNSAINDISNGIGMGYGNGTYMGMNSGNDIYGNMNCFP